MRVATALAFASALLATPAALSSSAQALMIHPGVDAAGPELVQTAHHRYWHRGGRGHHYGWYKPHRGHHYGWRKHKGWKHKGRW